MLPQISELPSLEQQKGLGLCLQAPPLQKHQTQWEEHCRGSNEQHEAPKALKALLSNYHPQGQGKPQGLPTTGCSPNIQRLTYGCQTAHEHL